MNRFFNGVLCVIFLALTYKFATEGQAHMGSDNPKAVLFTLGIAVVFGLGAFSSSGQKS